MDWYAVIKKVSEEIVTVAPLHFEDCDDAKIYEDARSAGFYAMGRALKTSKPVTLFVPGMFLTSVHTSLTECWFQKAPVVVVAFYEKISEVKTAWMDRCVIDTITVGGDEEEEIQKFIEKNVSVKGPVLLNIVGVPVAPAKKDYLKAVAKLQGKKKMSFNGCDTDTIPYKYKYGVISKYIGSSIVKDNGVLLCTSDCIMVDVNVFRTRYANRNMKIAVFDDGTMLENNVDLWIQSNGWECRVTNSVDDLEWLCNADKQSVLIIKEV